MMLPSAVEAAWMDQSHFVQILNKKVALRIQKKDYYFTHPQSPTIQSYNATGTQFIARINPVTLVVDPDSITCHLYTQKGEYLETLPLDVNAPRFDYDSVNGKRAISTLAQHNNAALKRLNSLHENEAQERLKQEHHNSQELSRMTDQETAAEIDKLSYAETTPPPVLPDPEKTTYNSRISSEIAASFEGGMQSENPPPRTPSIQASKLDPATEANNRIKALRKTNRKAQELAVQALDFHIEDVPDSDDF